MIQLQLQTNDPSATISGAEKMPFAPFGEDGLSFRDVLDIVNPLHHIPIIGSIYRKLSGDIIDPAMRIAGGAFFGGPIGAAISAVAVAVDEARRGDIESPANENLGLAENTPAHTDRTVPINTASAQQRASSAASVNLTHSSRSNRHDDSPRRGGWLVAQAYGEVPHQKRAIVAEIKQRIDLSV